MDNLLDKNIEWYRNEGRLEAFQITLDDYLDNSRRSESESIVDLEKHIWLLNSGAATLLIGYLQTQNQISCWQLYAACSFVLGVVIFFILKYISLPLTSRDRVRFQEAYSKFLYGEVTDMIFKSVRDKTSKYLNRTYVTLQFLSGFMFILGLLLLLAGVWPKP